MMEVIFSQTVNLTHAILILSQTPPFDEYEFYVHKVGFSLVYFLKWCDQIDQAITILSNFNYNKSGDTSISRADHFIYNFENYLIRVTSIHDKMLQLVNSVYHLCNEDSMVTHEVITKNLKVSRTKLPTLLNKLKKYFRAAEIKLRRNLM